MNRAKPMLFNADMVRAILSGEKTQTRRPLPDWQIPRPDEDLGFYAIAQRHPLYGYIVSGATESDCAKALADDAPCPFTGGYLWVRETTRVIGVKGGKYLVRYEADNTTALVDIPERIKPIKIGRCMPNGCYKEASRITLITYYYRVERLNDITEADCWAEGVLEIDGQFSNQEIVDMAARLHLSIEDARVQYALLWESIYGAGSWDKNPWVWVIEFKRME